MIFLKIKIKKELNERKKWRDFIAENMAGKNNNIYVTHRKLKLTGSTT